MSATPNAAGTQPGAQAPRAPFTATLRTRGAPLMLVDANTPDALTVRVQLPEVWEVRAAVAAPTTPIVTLKQRALAELYPQAASHEDFVLKLRGWEVLDEHATLAEAGVENGSILLLTHRRRRPIR